MPQTQKEILLLKNGEIILKGLNRAYFEDMLIRNLRKSLSAAGEWEVRKAQSTLYAEPAGPVDMELARRIVSKTFGIVSFSLALVCEKNMEDILKRGVPWLSSRLRDVTTFKVEARRSDKAFRLKSPEICAKMGEAVLQAFPHLTVDVHRPQRTVYVEIRDFGAYVHTDQEPGAGGMPAGTAGKAAVLLSGGIDSPVAAWMMAKRGLSLEAIHFASPPYTGPKSEHKVRELLNILREYAGRVPFVRVHFTEIQEQIKEHVPEDYNTLVTRRYMMKISAEIARRRGAAALITGESLGQVASQTLQAIACTDEASQIPVFRPLIGMDKEEIVTISRKIGTFETSILPYEDCCTVFTPRHPKTKPTLSGVLTAEAALDESALIERALNRLEISD